MAQDLYFSSSAASTTLSSGISNSATTMTVGAITGLPVSYPYLLIVDPDTASEEVVLVTAGGGTTLTITRGYDSTTGLSHSAGAVVVHGVSAKAFNDLYTLKDTVPTASSTTTFTNKDLSSATNTLPASVPKGTLGYATNSGAQTPTSGTDLTGLTTTVTVGTGRRIRISARVAVSSVSVTGSFYSITVYEGASAVGGGDVLFTSDSTGFQGTVYIETILTPTAGAHTYKLKFGSGSGTMTTAYSSASPSYILVEDIGV